VRYAGSILALAVIVAGSLGLLLAPTQVGPLLAKEGLSEHFSHLVLAIAAIVWFLLGWRHRPALLGAAFVLLVPGEETDWGAVYQGTAGINFHNAFGGHLYTLFALPLALFYGLAALSPAYLRRHLGGATPERLDLLVACACVILGPLAGLTAMGSHEAALDELVELALYIQVTGFAMRVWDVGEDTGSACNDITPQCRNRSRARRA